MKSIVTVFLLLFSGVSLSMAQVLVTPAQDKGMPYTRSAKSFAIAKIKNNIAVFSGSRYAWVNGYKVRLDDNNWRDEAITKEGAVFVPQSFAAILSLKEIKPNPAPEYLKEKWVYVDANDAEFPIDKNDFSTTVNGTKITFDCVFNAIHGTPGEDGLMQAYFCHNLPAIIIKLH